MSRRRARTNWRVDLDAAALERMAAKVCPLHGGCLADGYRLCGSSGVWRRRDGMLTVRLVYRGGDVSIVWTDRIARAAG